MKSKSVKIRLLVTGILLAILFLAVDLNKFLEALRSVSYTALLTATLGFGATQFISSTRWWVIMRAARINITWARAARVFFIGMYVNAFCFGTVGGDLVRALLAGNEKGDKSVSLAAVVADRALGLAVLASIGIIAGIAFGDISRQPLVSAAALATVLGAITAWWFVPSAAAFGSRRFPRIADSIARIGRAFPHSPVILTKVILLAALYHLSQIAVAGLIMYQVGGRVPVSYLLFAVPFVNIISTLPVSWMGVGLRETGFALFFSPMFMTRESAVLTGIIWLVGMAVASAFGGIIAAISGNLTAVKAPSAEDAEIPRLLGSG